MSDSGKQAAKTVAKGLLGVSKPLSDRDYQPAGEDPYRPDYSRSKSAGYARSDDLPERIRFPDNLINTDDPRQIQKPDRTDAVRLKRARYV